MASRMSCRYFRMLLKVDLTRFGLKTLVSTQQNNKYLEAYSIRSRTHCTKPPLPPTKPITETVNELPATNNELTLDEDVTIKYVRGLPHVTVPLPSRNEKCQFALKPISQNVGDFLQMLKSEDRGIDRATILNFEGVRISSACSIGNLMDDDFWLHVNDKEYLVKPPKIDRISNEEITKLSDVQTLVAQLYEALHVGEHQINKEKELYSKLEDLNMKLGPLEEKRVEFDLKAVRRTNALTWVGLGLMSVQFGILARLTWWEYSWDIMEPVTYFVTYGTAMAGYAYYVLTKQEYNLPDVRDRQYLITLHKRAKKGGLDMNEYNSLKREVAEVEHDLKRVRDPLQLHLPSRPPLPLYKTDLSKNNVVSPQQQSGLKDLFNSVSDKFK